MSDRTSEPTDVGPIAGGNLRASDADREQVATVLSTAFAEGRITQDEHEERLDQLLKAKTFDELVPITNDLVVVGPAVPAAAPAPTAHRFSIEPTSGDDTDNMVAVFGGVTRKGRWRVHRHTNSFVLFGGVELDMTDAVFLGQTVEISGFWCFGGVDIKVPPGIEVRDQTAGIFGGTEVKDVGDPVPGAPTLVIKGVTLFGGVSVHGPKASKRGRSKC